MLVTRNVWMKYHNPTDGEGNDLGGGAGGGADDKGGAADDDNGAIDDKGGATDDGGKGKTGPSDEEARLLKENMKKKGQIEELTKKLEGAQGVLKQLEELGGLDAIKALVGERKDAETKALEAKGDYERLKQRMAEEHSKEIKTLQERIATLEGEVGKRSRVINDLTIGTQFGQSQFISGELTLTPAKARVIYGDYFDVTEDGQVVGYDKPRGAQGRTALVDQYGNAVGFDAALRKIIEADPEKDHLMKSKVKAGAGSDSKKASGEPAKEISNDSMSKIAAGLKGLKVS